MKKELTLEEVLKAAEIHNNDVGCKKCPFYEDDCVSLFLKTVLELNMKNESLSAENKQLQLAIERKDKRFEEINNELILEKAKSEKLELEIKNLRKSLDVALNDNARIRELEDVIVNFKRTFVDFFNTLTDEQKSIWRIGMGFARANALADEIENKRKEGTCNE